MKPNTQLPRQSIHLDRDIRPLQSSPNQPRVDYHFRTPQEEPQLRGGGSAPEQTESELAPKFSDLSKSVFGISGDARPDHIAEALLFAVIVAISAFPIVLAIYVLSQTVY